jgi:hypothetical protein
MGGPRRPWVPAPHYPDPSCAEIEWCLLMAASNYPSPWRHDCSRFPGCAPGPGARSAHRRPRAPGRWQLDRRRPSRDDLVHRLSPARPDRQPTDTSDRGSRRGRGARRRHRPDRAPLRSRPTGHHRHLRMAGRPLGPPSNGIHERSPSLAAFGKLRRWRARPPPRSDPRLRRPGATRRRHVWPVRTGGAVDHRARARRIRFSIEMLAAGPASPELGRRGVTYCAAAVARTAPHPIGSGSCSDTSLANTRSSSRRGPSTQELCRASGCAPPARTGVPRGHCRWRRSPLGHSAYLIETGRDCRSATELPTCPARSRTHSGSTRRSPR